MNAPRLAGGPRSAQPPKGVASALVAAVSLAIGGGYYLLLVVVPFPPDWVRVVPAAWLAVATMGLLLGWAAVRARRQVSLGIAGLLLSLVSLGLAGLFMLGALVGD